MVSHAHHTASTATRDMLIFLPIVGVTGQESGVAISVIFLIFMQIVTVWILARYGVNAHMMLLSLMIAGRSVLIFSNCIIMKYYYLY